MSARIRLLRYAARRPLLALAVVTVVPVVAILAVVAVALVDFAEAPVVPVSVDTYLQTKGLAGRRARIFGEVVPGTLMKRNSPCAYRFSLGGREPLSVQYDGCTIPEELRSFHAQVDVEGAAKDGTFYATTVVVRPRTWVLRPRARQECVRRRGERVVANVLVRTDVGLPGARRGEALAAREHLRHALREGRRVGSDVLVCIRDLEVRDIRIVRVPSTTTPDLAVPGLSGQPWLLRAHKTRAHSATRWQSARDPGSSMRSSAGLSASHK